MFRKIAYICFSLILFLGLSGVGIMTVVEPTRQTTELRQLAEFPDGVNTLEHISELPQKFESWWSDSLFKRQIAVGLYNRIRVNFSVSPQGGTLVGKEGWLFLNKESVVDDYRNSRLLTERDLQRWRTYLIFHDAYVRNNGGTYYFVIPPNKHTVYSNFMPDHVQKLADQSRFDQVLKVMEGTDVNIIDLRPALLEGKKQSRVYIKYDSHWNYMGANYAQYAIFSKIAEEHPDITPKLFSKDDFSWEYYTTFKKADFRYMSGHLNAMGLKGNAEPQPFLLNYDGDCLKKRPANYLEMWPDISPSDKRRRFQSWECNSGHYRALIYRDSFTDHLEPYFKTTFLQSDFVSLQSAYLVEWLKIIDVIKPDIVIDESIERHLRLIPRAGRHYPADFNPEKPDEYFIKKAAK